MRIFTLISVLTTGLLTQSVAQEIHMQIQQKFSEYAVSHLQEKLFLHTDREVYVAGETLWFKAYAVDGTFHKPLRMSKVLYLELIDQNKKSVVQKKIDLVNGKASGSILIPDLNGKYLIRAYTRWMRNSDPSFFFQKTITIIGSAVQDGGGAQQVDVASIEPSIGFYPEGGDLVAGIESRIGVKIFGTNGRGVDASGVILNQSADTIVSFKTLRFGIGSFNFKPIAGQSYRVLYTVADKLYSGTLPQVKTQGYVMRATANSGILNIKVSYAGPKSDGQEVFLLAHTRQFPYATLRATLKNSTGEFQLALKDMLEGITHLTIFNDQRLPVCERLHFQQPKTKLTIGASLNKNVFTTRDEVLLTLGVIENTTSETSLSMAVYNLDSLQAKAGSSIIDYLLLTSDLQGDIESPEYYFSSDADVNEATDNLMLTHGWRRFSWKSVFDYDRQPARFSPESEGMVVSGQIKIMGPLQTVSQQQLLLSVHGGSVNVFTAESNSNGRFEFYVSDVKGVKDMIIVNRNNTLLTYALDNAFEDSVYLAGPLSRHRSANSLTTRERLTHAQVMNQIVMYSEKVQDTAMVEFPFYGNASVTYKMADYVLFPKVEDVLREYVPEVIVRSNERRLQMFLLDKERNVFFPEPPLVLVDGVPIMNTNKLIRGSASSLEKIEIVPKKFFLGPNEFPGIINFRTFNRNLTGFDLDSTSFVFSVEGPQVEREFYSPIYQDQESKNSRLPDFRHLLYWNPDVKISSANQALRFYTGDKVGRYIGVIHGLTSDGTMGSRTFTFEVKEPPRQ